jgi:hypothetical protein
MVIHPFLRLRLIAPEFNVGSHPGDSTDYVNAKDMLSLSLLQAQSVDLKLPIKIIEGE